MRVKVKKMSEGAAVPFKTYDSDFCYDCVATSCEEVAPGVYKYGLGLAFQMERGIEGSFIGPVNFGVIDEEMLDPRTFIFSAGYDLEVCNVRLSLDFRPRSSVWKTGMVLSNCTGTIDELYRGEVSAVFYHVMPAMPKYEVGDRIGQIKLGLTLSLEFEEVEELDNSERGTGSYGSTGR